VLADVLDGEGRSVARSLGPQAHYVHLDVREPAGWARAARPSVHSARYTSW
jgi:3alpha(or 20beta)-hydroxysteroid dehydrogenase